MIRLLEVCMLMVGATLVFSGCIPSEAPESAQQGPGRDKAELRPQPGREPQRQPLVSQTGLSPMTQEESPEALLAEWERMAESAAENLGNPRLKSLGAALNRHGAECLVPLFDVLADPEASPYKKLLVVETLDLLANEKMLPNLKPMVAQDQEGTTRACAATLLGLIEAPEAQALLKPLLDDSEKRVQLAAALALAAKGDAAARGLLRELYASPQARPENHSAIARTLCVEPEPGDLALLEKAVADTAIDVATRMQVAASLGRHGGRSAIPVLKDIAQNDPSPDVQDVAQTSVDMLERRFGSGQASP